MPPTADDTADDAVDASSERLFLPWEVAALMRVDPKTVTRWAQKGRISSILTPGGHRRIPSSAVQRLLNGPQTASDR
ncbi:helix-turn-helix domain-containing protein [Nonomuraea sp. CA-141351]|uniref:helix-turn-helix domain-containing protein n=1 Tax=Nonomuraea sp. CA-141351 TaxID=3239996 RepID=UPI003D93C4C1